MSQLLCGAGRYSGAQALPVQIKELRIVHKVGQLSLHLVFIFLSFIHCSLIQFNLHMLHLTKFSLLFTQSRVP